MPLTSRTLLRRLLCAVFPARRPTMCRALVLLWVVRRCMSLADWVYLRAETVNLELEDSSHES